MLAGIGTKKFTLDEAVSKHIKVKDIFDPDIKIREKYLKKYERYKKVYTQISQLYK